MFIGMLCSALRQSLKHATFTARSLPPARPRIYRPPVHLRFAMASTTQPQERFKLVFYVPVGDAETCKDAVFDTGAGSFPGGKYSRACFQSLGTGQFLPGDGATPNIGRVGALEKVEELKVEVLCLGRPIMQAAVKALLKAHPYEEPAYEVYKMEDV